MKRLAPLILALAAACDRDDPMSYEEALRLYDLRPGTLYHSIAGCNPVGAAYHWDAELHQDRWSVSRCYCISGQHTEDREEIEESAGIECHGFNLVHVIDSWYEWD